MNILGIETSCDETSASIISNSTLISNVVYTQEIHKQYGGVVPELASQEHLNEIIDVINSALSEAKLSLSDLDGIAVTYGPGLMGSLLIGLNFVKAMSLSLNIPFLGVNHLEGIILFKSLSKDEKKRIKDIFVPDFELEVTVQEIDEELRKIILLADYSQN